MGTLYISIVTHRMRQNNNPYSEKPWSVCRAILMHESTEKTVYVLFSVVTITWRWWFCNYYSMIISRLVRTCQTKFRSGEKNYLSLGIRQMIRYLLHLCKRKSAGEYWIIIQKNVMSVRAPTQQSAKYSALKHADGVGLSDRSTSRILHTVLHMHS